MLGPSGYSFSWDLQPRRCQTWRRCGRRRVCNGLHVCDPTQKDDLFAESIVARSTLALKVELKTRAEDAEFEAMGIHGPNKTSLRCGAFAQQLFGLLSLSFPDLEIL